LASNQLCTEDEEIPRSPSPPPKYDSHGKRTNTREQRAKDKLTAERQKLIQEALLANPVLSKVMPHLQRWTTKNHCTIHNKKFNNQTTNITKTHLHTKNSHHFLDSTRSGKHQTVNSDLFSCLAVLLV